MPFSKWPPFFNMTATFPAYRGITVWIQKRQNVKGNWLTCCMNMDIVGRAFCTLSSPPHASVNSVAYSAPNHYLNKCWVIDNWALGNKLQWHFKYKTFHSLKCSWNHRLRNGGHFVMGEIIELRQVAINKYYPDSKVHGANMGPTWVLSVPDGPHVGPMNLAIRVDSPPVPQKGIITAVTATLVKHMSNILPNLNTIVMQLVVENSC